MNQSYPIVDKMGNIFKIIQGHQITDEEIYQNQGIYPIYTGPNTIKGYWNRTIVEQDKLPCLTYATKAFEGTITIQNSLFDVNNTAVLIPKKRYKDLILLEWFKCVLPNIFFKIMTSKEGVSYLNKELIEKIELSIPKLEIQKKQINLYNQLIDLSNKTNFVKCKIIDMLDKSLLFKYYTYQVKNVSIKKYIGYMSGNSGLTEEFIYHSLQNEGEKYTVLSSATEERTMMGEIAMCTINNKPLKVFENKEGLLVTRNGKAGRTRFLEKGKYTINDHAYILFVKDLSPYKINLKWLAIQYRSEFLSYSSSSDNGTWNMTGFFEHVYIDIPSTQEQERVVYLYEKLESLLNKI